MDTYIVVFQDAFGHREVRKVCRSLAGAQSYVNAALAKGFATDITWAYLTDTTDCLAYACFRGPHAGYELVTFSIQRHEMLD